MHTALFALAGSLIATAAVADVATTPCQTIRLFLEDYVSTHRGAPVDTGQFEFLQASINVGYETTYLPPNMPSVLGRSIEATDFTIDANVSVSALSAKSFQTFDQALSSVPSVELDDPRMRSFLAKVAHEKNEPDSLFNADSLVNVTDLRPFSNHVILSETQGSMYCTFAMIFEVSGTKLIPSSAEMQDTGSCWTEGLTAIRVGERAYPAIWQIANDADLTYGINLLDPERTDLSLENALCKVGVTFHPEEVVAYWYPAPGLDPALLRKLQAALDPIASSGDEAASAAKLAALRPEPTGNSLYDELLRSPERAEEILRLIDPDAKMAYIPNADDQAYSLWSEPDVIPKAEPFAVDGHRLLLIDGVPVFGWRELNDSAFAIWEWNGKTVVPILSGYLGKRATDPAIAVQ